jgi:NAD(P)-dependent dehydrogenase (short-subunit alcohol dehydrogenase family)
MRLAGKVAMVTGGGAGIGRAIVLAMAREGADVFIPDIQAANAEAVVEEVRGLGRRAAALRTDVTKESEIEAVIAEMG